MDLDIYTTEMSKSVWDKAFFMDKIPGAKCVIDFGCADGAMIRFLAGLFPNIEFFGYDMNNELLRRARVMTPEYYAVSYWHSSEIEPMIRQIKCSYKSEEICLNFSSVLHEVFSSSPEGKEAIRTIIDKLHPRYITIRDMFFEDYRNGLLNSVIRDMMLKDVNADDYAKFVDKFGNVKTWKDLIHFLMKYQWHNNGYEQELEENYFSWTFNDLINLITVDDISYKAIYENEYMLPYYWEQWKKFIGPHMHTHAQFILRRDD